MNDGLTDDEARAGDVVLLFLIIVFTGPFWFAFLMHLYTTYWN